MASAPSQIILLQLFLYAFLSTAAFFLRDPSSSTDDHHLKSSTRLKALTFGQTLQERQTVNQYLEKIKEYEIKQHPEEVEAGKFDTKLSRALNDFMRRQKDDSTKSINPEENGRHFEGDIVLDAEQAKDIYERTVQQRRRTKRKFVSSELRRWDPHKPIVYSFDGSHTLREQRIIELALQHWHNITCLNFERRNDEPEGNRIIFTDVDGCASNVGRHPLGEPQYVSLSPECIRLGVIAHEVAHALGFWHEQSRPDRDNYVTVRWENIDRDSKGQFLKELPADVDNGSVPYDYGSIMHYRSKAFGRYDDLFTLNTNIADYQKTIGQRDQLSFNDIRLMNVIYCTNVCPKELPCLRGGYTDPRRCDRCRCPDGFTGRLCEEVMPGYGAECGGRLQLGLGWTRITSPGYPTEFREGQECSWLLTALPGQRVQLRFYGEFEMYCKVQHSLCMDYIEIRNSTDFANTGMRYCCYGAPKTTIESATEDMLVLFRSFYRSGKGFQAQVRSIPLNGALLSEPQWSEWSQWSACSASCGACGTRTRQRLCPLGHNDCFGESTQNEVCNDAPCRGYCTKKKFVETKCGGLLDLITGLRCRQEKSVTEPCNEHCCNGFKTSKGRCIRQRANES